MKGRVYRAGSVCADYVGSPGLYAFEISSHMVKVGRSRDRFARIAQLRTSYPNGGRVWMSAPHTRIVESEAEFIKLVGQHFTQHRREFFAAPFEAVAEIGERIECPGAEGAVGLLAIAKLTVPMALHQAVKAVAAKHGRFVYDLVAECLRANSFISAAEKELEGRAA